MLTTAGIAAETKLQKEFTNLVAAIASA